MGKFSMNSRVRDILKDKAAVNLVEKYFPGATSHPKIFMVYGMKVGSLLKYKEQANLSEEHVKIFLEEFLKL